MSILRQDPITRQWVIFATERAQRPDEFRRKEDREGLPSYRESCPFCSGNESQTPPEVLAYRDSGEANGPGWCLRATPNKYPALDPRCPGTRTERGPLFRQMEGVGAHEVLIETPVHNRFMALMEDHEVEEILWAYRDRYHALKKDPRVKLIILFKNHGESAGTSLEHPHSQIVATPVVPAHIRRKYEVATSYFDNTGRCIHCHLLQEELAARERIVLETDQFVVLHPYASRSPFETWIMPKRHRSSFGNVPDEELAHLAGVLRVTLRKIYVHLNNPDFNYVIHTAPVDDEHKSYYLWHVQILPRLTTVAGFEIGSGIYINTALPEETARFMREAGV